MRNIMQTSAFVLITVAFGLNVGCYGGDPTGIDTNPESTSADSGTSGDAGSSPTSNRPAPPIPQGEAEDPNPEEDALTACITSHHHGPHLEAHTYETIMGCDCGGNRLRNFYHVWNVGHGSCEAIGWASPDPRDCRVRVRINRSALWFQGDCHAQVDATATCDGQCGEGVLWRDRNTGELWVEPMRGDSPTGRLSLGPVSSDWTVIGVGDFNGDGAKDILWRHNTGWLSIWMMRGTSVLAFVQPGYPVAPWRFEAIGDFNGDRTSDIMFRNPNTGQLSVWRMQNGQIVSMYDPTPSTPSSDWVIVGTGDFNGDRTADVHA